MFINYNSNNNNGNNNDYNNNSSSSNDNNNNNTNDNNINCNCNIYNNSIDHSYMCLIKFQLKYHPSVRSESRRASVCTGISHFYNTHISHLFAFDCMIFTPQSLGSSSKVWIFVL